MRNKKQPKMSRWEMTYGIIATRIGRKGLLNKQNVLSVAKFLGAFVYVFSYPYDMIMTARMKRKLARIKKTQGN